MVMFSKVIMVGCGAVGSSLLGLLHHAKDPILQRIIVVSQFEKDLVLAKEMGIETHLSEITNSNFEEIFLSLAQGKTMILNLANNVSTYDLMKLCKKMEWNYLDAAANMWSLLDENSSYLDCLVKLENFRTVGKTPTMLCGFGVNPGLVSVFAKQALSDIADIAINK